MTFAMASLAVGSLLAGSPQERDLTARFELPPCAPGEPEWEILLAASSPQLANPTSLDVDTDGRAWVTEALHYRGIPERDPKAMRRERGDRVVILVDRDGDGVYDESKVFVEDPDLLAPLGIAVLGPPGGPREVYVSCSPAIHRYIDADGDDVPERRELFLGGFGGRDHDHGVHAVVRGPDGALWFNAGNQGPHAVTDPDGRLLLRAGSFIDGGFPAVPDPDADGIPSFVGGIAMRFDRDSGVLACVGHNFRNCYEIAVDSFGDVWQNDNDDDGNEGCRIAWVMPGANQGYTSADGRRSWQADRRPGQATAIAHWHQDDPGVAPSGAITGAGGPTGILRCESDALGAAFEGALLSCDAGRSLIWSCVPEARGAGFVLAPAPFLVPRAGDPERSLFRPSDVALDHDGSLLIADWWDPMVGGHGMLDREGQGRLLRVRRRGAAARRPAARPDVSTPEGALAALDSPVVHGRAAAFDALSRSPLAEAVDVAAIGAAVESLGPTAAAARRMWLLARLGEAGRSVVRRWRDAAADDPRTRVALRAVPPDWSSEQGVALAVRLAGTGSPVLRREVALAMRGASARHRREVAVALARELDPADRFELEAFGALCGGIEEAVWPDLMAALGDVPLQWSERFAAIAWRLHPRAAVDALVVRARSGALAAASRRQAVDALAFVPDPETVAAALHELVAHGADDVRSQALAWLPQRGGSSLARGNVAWQSDVLRRESSPTNVREVDVDLGAAQMLWLLVDDGGDGNSHDWADWLEPTLHGAQQPDGTRDELRLTALSPLVATVGWGSLGTDRNAGGGPLEVEGRRSEWGFGVHADSELAFLLPPGRFTRFTARVAPDDGGVRQPGARTSLRFRVLLGPAPGVDGAAGAGVAEADAAARRSLVADRDRLADAGTPRAERVRLARALAERPAAGLLLIELAAGGALDAGLLEAAASGLLRHPELSVRALASEFFPRLAADGAALPADAELLSIAGDARRGRELFVSEHAGCARCHRHDAHGSGSGGDVGPALTMIAAKYDRAALLDALLRPSAAISFGYEPWIVSTRSGDVLSGFLLADGDPVILKEATGLRRTIPAAEIASKRRSKLSLMPDNVATGLTAQEIADLIEFLAQSR